MTPLSVGAVVEVAVTDLLTSGQGIGRAVGMVVFVWGPLPGERARVRIAQRKPKYAIAELVELLTFSSQRAVPFCPVFGRCGGCQLQHLTYEGQLAWKRSMVESALRRIGHVKPLTVCKTVGMEFPQAYRNKMALVVARGQDGVGFGFYRARSHDVVTIEACPVVRPQLDRTIAALWEVARRPQTAPAFRAVKHVVARAGGANDLVASFTTQHPSPELRERGSAVSAALPGVSGLTNSYGLAGANAVLGRKSVTVAGRPQTTEEIEGLSFRVSPSSFFQVNSEMVASIFRFLAPRVPPGSRILDLYCGVGTFGLFFARLGARVTGIEESAEAVREAKRNADSNGLGAAITFLRGRVEQVVHEDRVVAALGESDIAFLDPPRKGSDEAVLRALCSAGIPHVWYLSCNPATLARDVAVLVQGAYEIDVVQPFDMFPHTGHVEAFVALRKPTAPPLGFADEARGAH